jgi:hypothetical protein
MTSKEMLKTQCKPGYWFVNTSSLGKKPNWQQQLAPVKQTKKEVKA